MVATQEDEANMHRAREKLLARRRNSAAATQTKSLEKHKKCSNGQTKLQKKQPSVPNKEKQQDTQDGKEPYTDSSSYGRKSGFSKGSRERNNSHERDKQKTRTMSSNRGETSSSAPPPRGRFPPRDRHHYRDEFGRQYPPRNHYDYPPYQHRGPPPPPRHRGPHRADGRWERDRGINPLPPHLRDHPGRSPLRYHRDDRHYRDRHRDRYRRGRSPESDRSRSSRSRSRSVSRGGSSSSSFSSSDSGRSGSHDSDESRSPSRSRSRSYSRSPSPQSPVKTNGQQESAAIAEQNKKDGGIKKKDNVDKPLEDDAKKEDGNNEAESPSSSKGASEKDNIRVGKRSRSRSASEDSHGRSHRRGRDRKRKSSRKKSSARSGSRSPASSVSRSHSPDYSSSSSHYSRQRRREKRSKRRRRKQNRRGEDALFSKDQRTIFVSQLVMRTTERDIKKYFKRKVGCKVNDVILLRDRRNARNHKGCAYVEVGRIEDVATAVAVSGQPPDFQRFPILIKASEAEKNYANPSSSSNTSNNPSANHYSNLTTKMDGPMSSPANAVASNTNGYFNGYDDREKQAAGYSTKPSFLPPLRDENGRLIESQKVYVGNLEPSVRQDHLYALFSQFGNLKKVQLQYHPNTQISRGYAFLTFHDPKVSHLAIRTMTGKFVSGRPLKMGWANQNQQSPASIASGCIVVISDQFPDNASELAQKALAVLAQMTGGTAAQQFSTASAAGSNNPGISGSSDAMALSSMAEQELDKAMGLAGTTTATVAAMPTVADARATMGSTMGATVAEARASLAADVAARQLAAATAVAAAVETQKSAFIGNTSNPSCHLIIHNMYDKDEETDPGWEVEIKEEFLDECSKFGKIEHAKVMHLEPGGKIFATFSTLEGAKNCAKNLAGRWFDKRQLRVDYMPEANPP